MPSLSPLGHQSAVNCQGSKGGRTLLLSLSLLKTQTPVVKRQNCTLSGLHVLGAKCLLHCTHVTDALMWWSLYAIGVPRRASDEREPFRHRRAAIIIIIIKAAAEAVFSPKFLGTCEDNVVTSIYVRVPLGMTRANSRFSPFPPSYVRIQGAPLIL